MIIVGFFILALQQNEFFWQLILAMQRQTIVSLTPRNLTEE